MSTEEEAQDSLSLIWLGVPGLGLVHDRDRGHLSESDVPTLVRALVQVTELVEVGVMLMVEGVAVV